MKKVLLIISVFVFVLVGCSIDPVDEYLNEYENAVEEWESKANSSTITLTDLNELNQATLKFSEKLNELKKAEDFSSDQLERYAELSSRLSKAFLKMSKNKPTFGY